MGSESILTGHIEGASEFLQTPYFNKANRHVLSSLSNTDTWPFLTRDLFALANDEHIYRTQIITFGTSYKMIERSWGEWLAKFEELLRKLFWIKCDVYLQTEIVGDFHYQWVVLESEIERISNESLPLSPIQAWNFGGGPREFSAYFTK
jgi:hypothetical protein